MDALEHLKQKNEKHAGLLKKERREAIPIFLNMVFVVVLYYYEAYKNIESGFTTERVGTLLFIFTVYNVAVFMFCVEVTKNYFVKCALILLCHGVCLYFWIWEQDIWSTAYFIGLLYSALALIFLGKSIISRGNET